LKSYRGVNLVSLPTIKSKHLDAIAHSFIATLHAMYVEKVDLIHYVNIGPALVSWLPRILKPKIKVVGKFECMDWNHQKWGGFAKFSLKLGAWAVCRFPHRTFATSEEIKHFAELSYGKKLKVVNNGYEVKEPMDKPELDKRLASLGLEDDNFMLSASRLIRHKGIHYLIDAFKQVKANGIPEKHQDLKLVIAGEGFHTEDYVSELKQQAASRGDIMFVGNQSGETLQALFEGAKACVLPTESEGFSMLLVEWLGYSRAVVASDIAPNMEAVSEKDGKRLALIFKNKSVKNLKEKLNYVVQNDMSELTRLAHERAKVRFSWDSVTDKVESIFTG
jgi:glycosyltransferase involved in cell wall biosynthesis